VSFKLHGWYVDIEAGALMAYSARQQRFLPLVCPLVPRRGAQLDQVDKSDLPWTDSEEAARTA
jgi:carbonic anhydrase